jgi:hypothetical protein
MKLIQLACHTRHEIGDANDKQHSTDALLDLAMRWRLALRWE